MPMSYLAHSWRLSRRRAIPYVIIPGTEDVADIAGPAPDPDGDRQAFLKEAG